MPITEAIAPIDEIHVTLSMGQPLGVDVGVGRHSDATESFQVRFGVHTYPLTGDLATTWLAAHDGELPEVRLGERSAIHQRLRALGVAQPDAAIATLTEHSLLTSFCASASSLAQLAARIRVCPLMIGLGSDPDNQGSYWLGYPNQRRIETAAPNFYLCTVSRLYRSLLEAAIDLSDRIQIGRAEYDAERSPSEILAAFFAQLPEIIRSGAVYLDRAVESMAAP